MSAAAAPWSVKGIDPKAREIAKDLARRSGMTLGEWLNSMIMDEPEDDDQVATLPRRSPIPDPYDRRSRSRRLDDAYAGPSIEVIADRLEAAERRSAEAIRSIESAVAGLVRRLDDQEEQQSTLNRRVNTVAEELREGHQRLRRVEQDTRPAVLEDLTLVSRRLDEAQSQTQAALKALERSFASLDDRVRQSESHSHSEPSATQSESRFERLAETLSRQVEGNRIEMMRRLDVVEVENRTERIERALNAVTEHSRQAEQKSAAAVEAMGREVMRIAQNLDGRMARVEQGGQVEQIGQALREKLERDLERHAQQVDLRLTRSDDHHARAIERLGDEITRISDRLSDRIATSERRSAEALDDIGRRLAEQAERVDSRHLMHGELAERMRQSEERTASLLAEARENLSQRGQRSAAAALAGLGEVEIPPAPVMPADALGGPADHAPWTPAEAPRNDWRAAAFGDGGDIWSDDDLDGLLDAAPFPSPAVPTAVGAGTDAEGATEAPPVFADPLEAELGAWVEARTREATPSGPFGSLAERSEFGRVEAGLEPDEDVRAETEWATIEAEMARPTASLDQAPAQAVDRPQPLAFDPTSQPLDDLLDRPLRDEMALGGAEAGPPHDVLDGPLFDDAAPGGADDLMIDRDALRTAAETGRQSTREALDAARAAMVESEAPAKQGFSLKRRGGKSKLQERLDKQAKGEGGGIRKIFGASALAALMVCGGYGFLELSKLADGQGAGPQPASGTDGGSVGGTSPIAALALAVTPTEATPSTDIAATQGTSLFERATELLDKGDDSGVEVLRRAADLGHAGAQLRLADLYQSGSASLEADPVEARNWARRAAEGGDARAMHYYAMQLYDGAGGPQNRTAALGWLKRAAEAGRVDSQYNVARLYETGDTGVARNPLEAFKWYMIAARRGDQQALAAVQRLTPNTDADTRRKAREAADTFNVDPLG
ncbi:hypothetical protein [Brevundimonas vesicularis]|uniref:hypothetical protein n=1 Tax=Brevundimonas vesicularis TaxID=41276 RepID=UPI0038D39BF9